ncbi:MAG: DUF6432 family protein [Haloarculaceae archaeon]
MQAKREYRNRDETQVAVLDALVGRPEEGMSVLELRSRTGVDIDRIEDALAELKADDLIEVDRKGERTLIRPRDRVVPEPGAGSGERSLVDRLLEKFPF